MMHSQRVESLNELHSPYVTAREFIYYSFRVDGFLLISDGSGNRLLHLFPVVTRFPTPRDGYLARLLLNIENKANPGIFRRQLLDVKTRGPPRRETILYLLLSFYPVDSFLFFFSSLIQPFHLLGGNLRRFPRVHTHTHTCRL